MPVELAVEELLRLLGEHHRARDVLGPREENHALLAGLWTRTAGRAE